MKNEFLKKNKLKNEWKSRKIEKILISFICVWLEVFRRVEKWRNEIFFWLIEKKKKMRIENVVCINLFLCPHIKHFNFFLYIILLINIFFFYLFKLLLKSHVATVLVPIFGWVWYWTFIKEKKEKKNVDSGKFFLYFILLKLILLSW